jgi:hypothetical protein
LKEAKFLLDEWGHERTRARWQLSSTAPYDVAGARLQKDFMGFAINLEIVGHQWAY